MLRALLSVLVCFVTFETNGWANWLFCPAGMMPEIAAGSVVAIGLRFVLEERTTCLARSAVYCFVMELEGLSATREVLSFWADSYDILVFVDYWSKSDGFSPCFVIFG